MKKILVFFSVLVAMLCASCSTQQTINVFGKPGTKLYAPQSNRLTADTPVKGVIDNTGKAQLVFNDNFYHSYLLCQDPDNGMLIPMALDSKYCNHKGATVAKITGYVFLTYGGVMAIAGAAAAGMNADGGTVGTMMGVGAAFLAAGTGLGVPGDSRSRQVAYQYNYQYLKDQKTPQDLVFTTPVYSEPGKSEMKNVARGNQPGSAVSASPAESASSRSLSNTTGEKTRRTLKGNAGNAVGNYSGRGELLENTRNVESYSSIAVQISQVDNNTVAVRVIEGGEDYFNTPEEFKVDAESNGDLLLTHKNIPSCQIRIKPDGSLSYSHPKVNIEGGIYKLNINAAKVK